MTHKAHRDIMGVTTQPKRRSNMCHYTHFSTEERELSRVLQAQGLSIRAIARMLYRGQRQGVCCSSGTVRSSGHESVFFVSLIPRGSVALMKTPTVSCVSFSRKALPLPIFPMMIYNRSRKRFNFLSPFEVLKKFFSNCVALVLTIYHTNSKSPYRQSL